MIELVGVTKAYPTHAGVHVVLDDLTCTFPTGVSVGILGKNGAGKSTLMRLLGGAELPDEGEIHRTGRVSWPIGFAGGFHGSLTGEENCRFAARVYGSDPDEVAEHTRAFAELGVYFQMPVRTYSSGMKARLGFGLSMAIDFDTYLVDEVVAVGDYTFRERCRRAFDGRRERSSLILVSHQSGILREHAERFAVLEAGRLRWFDDLDEAERIYQRRAA